MAFLDDFDYPMPKRQTNWTLRDEEHKRRTTYIHPINKTSDIEGAMAGTTQVFRAMKFSNKPDLHGTLDVDGASPARLVPTSVNKPNNRHVSNKDIEHSFPESKLFSTPRVVDPLCPVYPLPQMHTRPPTPPFMLRETMKLSDIDGTKPKPKWRRSVETNPLDYSDIPFSKAGYTWEYRKRKTPSMNLVTEDIRNDRRRAAGRSSNPLEPVYKLPSIANQPIEIGHIQKSKPKGVPPLRNDRPLFSLQSHDIDGCAPGSHIPFPKERRQWKVTCDLSGISLKGKRTFD